ncbi:hypothetical protein PR202_ga23631 [Eleusine coracana subsp. coracana]|uniref:Uncharacterized protein n=1 Tax=Eleusine coracana subsp. coracana TaxID=191504 RepID=A0AAV5D756_ELECO|nr:hypothetical protein PR202_ga23631 [Eleusine coracana subsp. coracana]
MLIALDVPKWWIKAIEKIIRAFLWHGRKEAHGGHCPITWEQATRPLKFGGLGIFNLETLGWTLQMHWLWLRKTDPNRSWRSFNIQVPREAQAMFALSVTTEVGDGANTLFWSDRWILGRAVRDLAPTLMIHVSKRALRHRTVQQAMQNDAWLDDFGRGLPVAAIWEVLQLWGRCPCHFTNRRCDRSTQMVAQGVGAVLHQVSVP